MMYERVHAFNNPLGRAALPLDTAGLSILNNRLRKLKSQQVYLDISQKISMTLVSIGIRSMFLRPTDALHGDIGMMRAGDILVLMSKSGSSEELITLIPYALAKGIRLIGVTSNAELPKSQLDLTITCF